MTKTGFLGITTGNITWAGLLEGSAGVIGALLVAVIAFRLQVRETRRADLRRAVETMLDDIVHVQNVLTRAWTTKEKLDLGTKAEISFQVVRASTQVATRCGWRDRALRDGLHELDALLSEAIWKAEESHPAFAVGQLFTGTWLAHPRTVRRQRVTVKGLLDQKTSQRAAAEAIARKRARLSAIEARAKQRPQPTPGNKPAPPAPATAETREHPESGR